MDNSGRPWGTTFFGHTAVSGGTYSTPRVPFARSLRVLIQPAPGTTTDSKYWFDVRGVEALPRVLEAAARVIAVQQRYANESDVSVVKPDDCAAVGRACEVAAEKEHCRTLVFETQELAKNRTRPEPKNKNGS